MHYFSQTHIIHECPMTEEWRNILTTNGNDAMEAITEKLTSIWETPGVNWKDQVKAKRTIIQPLGDLCRQWHAKEKFGTKDITMDFKAAC